MVEMACVSEAVISIPQMRDSKSAKSIESQIANIGGIRDISTSIQNKEIKVTFDMLEGLSAQDITIKISELGFEAILKNEYPKQMIFHRKGRSQL